MDRRSRPPSEFAENVVQVNRVSKKTKGGNQIGFSVLVVVGDKKDRVGVALGKAPDVLSSIKKGVRKAKKRLIHVTIKNGTIPFRVIANYGAARVLLKPAPQGSGIIAGGAVRDVLAVSGLKNVVGKILGSNNQANNAYATIKALKELQTICRVKGLEFTPVQVVPTQPSPPVKTDQPTPQINPAKKKPNIKKPAGHVTPKAAPAKK